MIRKIIQIDEQKCTGCGICISACHERAIEIIDGKAKLIKDDYCDGLGDCLPTCPTNAISFVEREAKPYDENAVIQRKNNLSSKNLNQSQLSQWPIQIKLVPINADYFNETDLLIAADCTAYAYGNFHNDFIKNKVTLIGCPKLDNIDYSDKLVAIIKNNNIKTITVTRMEVPCCGGIENALKIAIKNSGKDIPLKVVIITTDGSIR